MSLEINPPPLRIPETLRTTEDRLAYFEQLHEFLRLLWERTGGNEDLVDSSANLSRRVYTAEADEVINIQNSRSLDIEEQPEVVCRPAGEESSIQPDVVCPPGEVISMPDPSASGLAIDNERRLTVVEDEKTQAGYGALRQTVSTPIADISTLFEVVPANTGSVGSGQRGVTAIPANDSIRIDEQGVWYVSLALTLEFTESQQGRTFDVRVHNFTESTPVRTQQVHVGRNQSGVNWSIGFNVEITPDRVGDEFQVEIGNASTTIQTVTLLTYSFDIFRVSEKRE